MRKKVVAGSSVRRQRSVMIMRLIVCGIVCSGRSLGQVISISVEKAVVPVNPITPDAGQTGKPGDVTVDKLAGEIHELEEKKLQLQYDILILSRDRDKLWDDARAQVLEEMRKFVLSYFDEEFADAFKEFSEMHRPKDNAVAAYG